LDDKVVILERDEHEIRLDFKHCSDLWSNAFCCCSSMDVGDSGVIL